MVLYKEQIKETILQKQKKANPFAFIISSSETEEIWLIVNFHFYEFTSVVTFTYSIDIQSFASHGTQHLDNISFKDMNDLITFLADRRVDVNRLRAVH